MLGRKATSVLRPRGLIQLCRQESSQVISQDDVPVYPEIREVSFEASMRKKTEDHANAIRSKSSFEEKMMEVNMPRKYGWPTHVLNPIRISYGSQAFYQKVTRSGLISTDVLPIHSDLKQFKGLEDLRSRVVDAIEQELDFFASRTLPHSIPSLYNENATLTSVVASAVTRVLMCTASDYPIEDVEVEENPRSEAFWVVGNFSPTADVKNFRTKLAPEWLREKLDENEPMTHNFQYIGNPNVQLQSKHPLINSVEMNEGLSKDVSIPEWGYHPSKVGVVRKFRYGTNVSATWPYHDDRAFTIFSWLPFAFAYARTGHNDIKEYSDNLAMLHGFGSMSAQACRLGFSHLNKITYPMTTQVVVGDGQYLSFYQYQLNTNVLHPHLLSDNDPKNICWATPMHRLYECVENGRVKGFDDSVLLMLANMFRVEPVKASHELAPNFGKVKYIGDLEDLKKRKALDQDFKLMYSNRPQGSRTMPKIYDWERIYKIYFETRPQDARRKWWAKGERIVTQRYDDVKPQYVPKHLQDPPKKSRRGRSITKVITG